jgi:hypothetical protein
LLQLLLSAAQPTLTNQYHGKQQECSLLFILMDHNMVFSYDYAKQKRWQQKTNALSSRAMFMAMGIGWSNTNGIAP